MRRPLSAALYAIVLTMAGRAQAQTSDIGRAVLQPSIEELQRARAGKGSGTLTEVVDQVLSVPAPFVAAVAADADAVRFIVEANRIDKQVGAPARGKGSTNLVASGSVPRLLGFAVETGALTQSVSGSSITLQTNPVGLISTLANYLPGETDTATRHTLDFLRRFNVTATFDTSREADGRFTGSYRQLASASTQIYLYNHRDPTDGKWVSVWAGFVAGAGPGLPNAVTRLQVDLEAQAEYKSLREATRKRLLGATSDAEIESAVLEYANQLAPMLPLEASAQVIAAWTRYLRAQTMQYNELARSPILTFEYQLARPPVQDAPAEVSAAAPARADSDLSTAKLIFVRPFLGASDMTLNASASFFNRQPEGVRSGARDWQLAAKLDFPLDGIAGASKSQLTIAALFIHMRQPPLGFPVVVNDVPLEQTGNLRFVQARLRLPLGDSGISVPFSVTYATRTEFLKEKEVRGNVGLTLDFDKLAGALR